MRLLHYLIDSEGAIKVYKAVVRYVRGSKSER